MKKLFFLILLVVGGAMAFRRLVPDEGRETISHLPETMRGRMMERMARMMEDMPEDFPPKAIISGMRRIQEQNDELLALIREQNDLLRERARAAAAEPAS